MQRRPSPQQPIRASPILYENEARLDSGWIEDFAMYESTAKLVVILLQRLWSPLAPNVNSMRVESSQSFLAWLNGSNNDPVVDLEALVPQVL